MADIKQLQEKWAPVLNHDALPEIEDSYKKGFGPFGKGFVTAKFCWSGCSIKESIESFKSKINKNTCAIFNVG